MEILRLAVTAAFALLAVLTLRLWRERRTETSAWLAASFVALGVGLVGARLAPLLPDAAELAAARLSRVATVAFPYLLFRFAASIERPARPARVTAAVAGGAVMAAALLVPSPPPGAGPTWWYGVFVAGALAVWTVLSAWVVWLLWRSGRRQPTVARRRMRTLAVAAAVLNLALVVAGVTTTAGTGAAVTATIQGVGLLSAVLFYLGFAPPALLRGAWRRNDERALWRAESGLVAAETKEEVVTGMLPHVSHLLGGGAALYLDDGWERAYGEVSAELRRRFRDAELPAQGLAVSDRLVVLGLRQGRMGVETGPLTPLFGAEEMELTGWLGGLMELALDRVELHERERAARRRSQQLAAELESLVYGITHDLRNPIVAINGYLDCLAEDHGHLLDEDGRYFLARLRTNAEFMDRLISDLLALSRIGRVPEDAEDVELTAVAEHVAEELSRSHPEATISVEPLPTVTINAARARQLVTNLVSNALVHGGRPDVKVRIESVDPEGPGLACFAVIDNGRGVPEAYRGKVFGLFERLEHGDKDVGTGTGIGLSMCQRIVTQAGGRIWIAGSASGTDVRVQLPLASATSTESEV